MVQQFYLTLSGATISDQSGSGSDGNEMVFHIFWIPALLKIHIQIV